MHQQEEWKPEFTIRLTIAGVLFIVAALFIALFLTFADKREEIKFAAIMVGGAAALYSAYHAGAALRVNIHRDKQKRAYEILDAFNKYDSVKVRVLVADKMDGSIPSKDAYDAIQKDSEMHTNVRMLLGVLEDMSIAIQTQYADEAVLFRSLERATVMYYDGLKAYIDGVRQKNANQRLYCETEAMVGAWRQAHSIVTRKKLR